MKSSRKYKNVLTPVERAIATAKWKKQLTSAHLHALIGDDLNGMIDRVCAVFYIVGLGAHKAKIYNTDINILHGSCRTALDIAYAENVTPLQRSTLEAGLLAVERVKDTIPEKYLIEASIKCSLLLKVDGVYWHHFQEFIHEPVVST